MDIGTIIGGMHGDFIGIINDYYQDLLPNPLTLSLGGLQERGSLQLGTSPKIASASIKLPRISCVRTP